ncbi:MAG TPA: DNA recombination protein RmuC [Spirochaetia bacterium]|nr:DNA recombination protein RmuC [Spirochaetia bacterium]
MTSPLDCEPIIEALSRQIGQFEGRVAILEGKCMQMRSCIGRLVEEFHTARGSTTIADEHEQAHERLTVARVVELCGMKSHVELDYEAIRMIVHEPDGGCVTVDAVLGTTRLDEEKLEEEIRNRLDYLCHSVAAVDVMFVPVELDLRACFAGHEQLLQEAAGRHVCVAPPSALLSIVRGIALRWISSACGHSARTIVDKGQDLVDELSAFISDFTETEKMLCSLVDDCAQAARRRGQSVASQRG